MAAGIIARSVLTDIANAIRAQNGSAERYRPSEMAGAVLALDGTSAGAPLHATAPQGTGVISDAAFSAIADAIRAQNGSAETYTPAEMAPAILALSWDVGIKMRALLLSDGTLEFNYRDGRSSDVAGAAILRTWEVDAAGYASAGARPWDGDKLLVTRVVFDADFAQGGLSSAAYLFHGCTNLVEVEGFEALSGVTDMTQMFVSCASLETIWADGFVSSVTSGGLMFSGCTRLVGGQGYVPSMTDSHSKLAYGESGVLTDPGADARTWCRCFLYADGELVATAATEPEAGREVLAGGRMCVNARYAAVGATPWYEQRAEVTAATFDASMAGFAEASLNYWFYGHQALAGVSGLGNLRGVRELQHTFNSCKALESIDLSGMDPSGLKNLTYTFSGCTALTTIWADAGWALPTGVTGGGTFYNCPALVGGNGTTYSSSRITATYMRIDAEGVPGYLTGKS